MNASAISVLYPGSFDPLHVGHVDVIEQGVELFGRVVVVAMHNPAKPSGIFTIDERVAMIEASLAHLPGVQIEPFHGLAVDAADQFNTDFILKGLRNSGDFEIEQQMAHTNHSVSGVRTVFVPCRPDQVYVSSRFIREIAQYGGDVSHLVPAPVAAELARIFPTPARGTGSTS
jgi:pantetheine-phosphate adenylyltransferase